MAGKQNVAAARVCERSEREVPIFTRSATNMLEIQNKYKSTFFHVHAYNYRRRNSNFLNVFHDFSPSSEVFIDIDNLGELWGERLAFIKWENSKKLLWYNKLQNLKIRYMCFESVAANNNNCIHIIYSLWHIIYARKIASILHDITYSLKHILYAKIPAFT